MDNAKKRKISISFSSAVLSILISPLSHAFCIKVNSISSLSRQAIAAGYTASAWQSGTTAALSTPFSGLPSIINITNNMSFQPPGSLLASAVGQFLISGSIQHFSPNQILFRCSVNDANGLYEMYARNGSYPSAGQYATDEVDGAYYDIAANTAVRITNLKSGEYYSRYWKGRKLTADSWYADNEYIYIPASAFSDILYEIFKVSSTRQYQNSSSYFKDDFMPNRAMIAFKGPGLESDLLQVGQDSWFYQWGAREWPATWGTNGLVTFVRGASCQIEHVPPLVILPAATVRSLSLGEKKPSVFSVSVRCESGAKSDTRPSSSSNANIAMGFLVNQYESIAHANRLGLMTSGGGLTWLLDARYGQPGKASGVGIRIYDDKGEALNLLPDIRTTGTGNARGWYAYKSLTSLVSSGDGVDIYNGEFTASLEALPRQQITPGKVNAQLQVIISFQ